MDHFRKSSGNHKEMILKKRRKHLKLSSELGKNFYNPVNINRVIKNHQFENRKNAIMSFDTNEIHQGVTMLNKEIYNERLSKFNEVLGICKNEIHGSDELIESVFESIKVWWIAPDLLVKPVVVNLWGMTGTAKTTLVKLISEHFGLARQTYFNSVFEKNVFDDISKVIGLARFEKSIHVYDEFHKLNKFDKDEEKDKYLNKLESFLGDGKIDLAKIIVRLNWIFDFFFKGKKKNHWEKEIYFHCASDIAYFIRTVFQLINQEDIYKEFENKYSKINLVEMVNNEELSRTYTFSELLNADSWHIQNDTTFQIVVDDYKHRGYIKGACPFLLIKELLEILEITLKEKPIQPSMKLTGALIFFIGNFDELFGDVVYDNESDPSLIDYYHNHTKNFNIDEVKDTLGKFLRPEFISRMGNNHFVFPTVSSDGYRKIIDNTLNRISNEYKTLLDRHIHFTPSFKNQVFNTCIIASKGVRLLQDNINHLVSKTLSKIIEKSLDTHATIIVDYNTDINCITISDGITEKDLVGFDLVESKEIIHYGEERMATVAVHESGHALAYLIFNKMMPEKVYINSKNGSGFMKPHKYRDKQKAGSFRDTLEEVMILLAGSIAEKVIFGGVANGADSDRIKATRILTRAYRYSGMDSCLTNPAASTFNGNDPTKAYGVRGEEFNSLELRWVSDVIYACVDILTINFNSIKDQIKLLALKLYENKTLEEEDLNRILNKYLNKEKIMNFIYGDYFQLIEKEINSSRLDSLKN